MGRWPHSWIHGGVWRSEKIQMYKKRSKVEGGAGYPYDLHGNQIINKTPRRSCFLPHYFPVLVLLPIAIYPVSYWLITEFQALQFGLVQGKTRRKICFLRWGCGYIYVLDPGEEGKNQQASLRINSHGGSRGHADDWVWRVVYEKDLVQHSWRL